jgi:hypothetical protein
MFRDFSEQIVRQCIDVGLVEGQRFSVDGTIIAANASAQSRIPREELPEAAKVSRTAEEYLLELETQDDESHPDSPPGKPPSLTDTDGKVSTSDPDAAWASKGAPIHLSYYDNYLIDNGSNIIVDVEATPARTSQEIVAARLQLRANFEGRKRRSDRLSDDSSTPLSSTASTVFGTASRQQERRRL